MFVLTIPSSPYLSTPTKQQEQCYDELDAPVRRLCMDDAPVPYASSMEKVRTQHDFTQT